MRCRSRPAHFHSPGSHGQLDVGEVDGDEERLFDQLVVTLVGVDASFGRHDNAIDILVVGGVVEAGSTLEDVDRIVVPAQQAVGPEARKAFTVS